MYDHTTVWPYNHTTVQGATFNMCSQLYCRHANTTALFSSPVVSALGSKPDDMGSSPGRGKALCPWDVQEKKMQAPLLGLAKSIYYRLTEVLYVSSSWSSGILRRVCDLISPFLVIAKFCLGEQVLSLFRVKIFAAVFDFYGREGWGEKWICIKG